MPNPYAISPEQCEQIATSTMGWSEFDFNLGLALQHLYGLEAIAAVDLIFVLDIRKKVDLIQALNKRGQLPVPASGLVTELKWICKTYQPDRNMLAHGIPLYGNDEEGAASLWSHKKNSELSLADLTYVAIEAHYARNLSQQFLFRARGQEHPLPLPARPPERPAAE